MNQKNIFIDLEYCIGCRACEVACKQENDIPVGIKWINVIKVGPKMVGDKLRMDFVPMRCRHCAKAPCIDACPEKAISINFGKKELYRGGKEWWEPKKK